MRAGLAQGMKRRGLVITITAVVVLVLAAIAFLWRTQEANLLTQARRVARLPVGTVHCFIRPDDSILVVTHSDPDLYTIASLIPGTGKLSDPRLLDSQYTIGIDNIHFDWSISPDGRYLLWCQDRPHRARCVLYDLVDDKYSTFETRTDTQGSIVKLAWTSDSHYVIESCGSAESVRLIRHDISNLSRPMEYRLSVPCRQAYIVGACDTKRAVLGIMLEHPSWSLAEAEFPPSGDVCKVRDLPISYDLGIPVLSQTSQNVAWVRSSSQDRVRGFLDRLLQRPVTEQLGLFAGGIGDLSPRYIGSMPPVTVSDTSIQNLLWTHDERSLYFTESGMLYRIAVR
jgi:hypothetical protein